MCPEMLDCRWRLLALVFEMLAFVVGACWRLSLLSFALSLWQRFALNEQPPPRARSVVKEQRSSSLCMLSRWRWKVARTAEFCGWSQDHCWLM
jgi:hypothetical protein